MTEKRTITVRTETERRVLIEKALELAQRGCKPAAISSHLNVPKPTIKRWLARPEQYMKTAISKAAAKDVLDSDKDKAFSEILRENARLGKQLEKEMVKDEKMLEAINSSLAKLPAYFKQYLTYEPPKVPTTKKAHGPEDMALIYSDSQIGEKTTLRDTSGLSEYNWPIFQSMRRKLEEKVLLIRDIHTHAYNIETLWILGAGDYLTGEGVFPGQSHYIDQVVVDQVFFGAAEIAIMIRHFASIFPRVRMIMVSGQHGRGPKEYHWRSNWDYVFAKVLQILLKDVKNCDLLVAESALCAFEIRGHVFLLNHGTEIRSWMTIPFYGLERAALRWENVTRLPVEYVVIGDKHRNCSFDIAFLEAIINGSWSPGTKYSVDKMQAAGMATQKLFGVHDEQGKTWEYPLRLSEPPSLKKDEKGFYTPVSDVYEGKE